MRTRIQRALTVALALAATLALAAPALAATGAPNFGPAIYASGEVFGTKDATDLPPPSGDNQHSFDPIIAIGNGAAGQLPVAEAAPGEPGFNGGRWALHMASWTEAFLASNDAPLLTSYAEVLAHANAGHLVVDPAVARYFECPLLPVK